MMTIVARTIPLHITFVVEATRASGNLASQVRTMYSAMSSI